MCKRWNFYVYEAARIKFIYNHCCDISTLSAFPSLKKWLTQYVIIKGPCHYQLTVVFFALQIVRLAVVFTRKDTISAGPSRRKITLALVFHLRISTAQLYTGTNFTIWSSPVSSVRILAVFFVVSAFGASTNISKHNWVPEVKHPNSKRNKNILHSLSLKWDRIIAVIVVHTIRLMCVFFLPPAVKRDLVKWSG